MPEQDQARCRGHPGQTEPSSHGVHHETPLVNLNTADRREIEHLPIMEAQRAAEGYGLAPSRAGTM
jgi:DNA uptake protein ComE-like DNA-binding protein